MSKIITEIAGLCQWSGCQQLATGIFCGRSDVPGKGHPFAGLYCETHGNVIADESSPEYHDNCPNCGCTFGIN